jgi:hypothetical protein
MFINANAVHWFALQNISHTFLARHRFHIIISPNTDLY